MPRYLMTPGIRAKISRTLKGRKPVNTGCVNEVLINEIKKVIASTDTKLTRLQIFNALLAKGIDIKGYKRFYYHLLRACKTARLDKNQIVSMQGNHQHHAEKRKFHVGDKVRIIRQQNYTPKWLRKGLRLDNVRTITTIISPQRGRTNSALYYLGNNSMGETNVELHAFRANELEAYTKKTVAGRPSAKRKYIRQYKDTSPVNSELLVNSTVSPSISCVNCQMEAN